MIRVLVVLMFAELIIVVLLVDHRLDAVEAVAPRSSTVSLRQHHELREATRQADLPSTGIEMESVPHENVAAGGEMPTAVRWVSLTDEDRQLVVEDVYRAEKIWRRTAGLLESLTALRKRELIREIDRTERSKILGLARDYAGKRVRIEFTAMTGDLPDMDALRAQLDEFDSSEASRIEDELATFLNPAEAKQVARIVVPRAP